MQQQQQQPHDSKRKVHSTSSVQASAALPWRFQWNKSSCCCCCHSSCTPAARSCHRALMATRSISPRPRPPRSRHQPQQQQQVPPAWLSVCVTHHPSGLMARHSGGVGTAYTARTARTADGVGGRRGADRHSQHLWQYMADVLGRHWWR